MSNDISPARPLPHGVLPVFQTPFRSDESIDWETLEREIHWLLERGTDGVVMAMVSETLRLTERERLEMAAAVCRYVGGRGSIVISVGAESSYAAVQFALHAQDQGATAVMAIPPVSIGLPADQLLSYYERILRATALPVIVQDASGYVGRPLPIAMQAALLQQYGPQRVMFKPEAVPLGPNLSALREATAGKARVFEGSGGIALVDSYRRGIVGTMPGADLVTAIVPLWQALEAGDDDAAYRISLPLCALVSMQQGLDGFLAVEKHLLVRQGIFTSEHVRGPVGFHLDEETRLEVDRLWDRLTAAIREV